MYLPTCLMYSTGCPPAADYVPYWCHGLEVYPGPCSGLPPRSLLSNPGHQRSLIGTLVTLCSFCSHLHNPGPCILGGWPLCVEWASYVAKIAPQDRADTFFLTHFTLASKLFSLAVQGSEVLLSSNLEGALYKSP